MSQPPCRGTDGAHAAAAQLAAAGTGAADDVLTLGGNQSLSRIPLRR